MTDPVFCLRCGARTQVRTLPNEPRPRHVCPRCGWIFYPHRKVGAGVLIEEAGRLLLLQRGHEPWAGAWNLPAGYVEIDETPAQAAARETREETGLTVRIGPLVGVWAFDDDPRGNGLLIVYRAQVVGGKLQATPEARAARFFAPHEVPTALAGGAHDVVIRAWAAGRLPGGCHESL